MAATAFERDDDDDDDCMQSEFVETEPMRDKERELYLRMQVANFGLDSAQTTGATMLFIFHSVSVSNFRT